MKVKTRWSMQWLAVGGTLALSLTISLAWARATTGSSGDSTAGAEQATDPFAGFGNPATFAVANGKQLWNEPRGPKHVALAKTCNLGLGVGVIKGAYAHLPRYFKDTNEVQDLESRLLTCMVKGQGLDRAKIVNHVKGGPDDSLSGMASLAAYVAKASRGMPITLPLNTPQERRAYELGKKIFFYRSGPYDFSCATCHSQTGKHIRREAVPDLSVPGPGARESYVKWPAYRKSKGIVYTYEARLISCFRQTRTPELKYASPAAVDLTMFLAKNAAGAKMAAPGLTR